VILLVYAFIDGSETRAEETLKLLTTTSPQEERVKSRWGRRRFTGRLVR
jgi:hypothetical protein